MTRSGTWHHHQREWGTECGQIVTGVRLLLDTPYYVTWVKWGGCWRWIVLHTEVRLLGRDGPRLQMLFSKTQHEGRLVGTQMNKIKAWRGRRAEGLGT